MSDKTFFSLEILPARKGDCLILYHGTGTSPRVSIIDGGPSQVYGSSLKPRLKDIRASKGLADGEQLPIDLLMVSHIDDDHIKGLIDMAQEMKDNPHLADLVRIDNVWHNAFDDLIGNSQAQFASTAEVLASFGSSGLSGKLDHDQEAVFTSVRQGRTLRDLAQFFRDAQKGWASNRPAGGLMMMGAADDDKIDIIDGFDITILGPRREEIEELQEKWDKFLEETGQGQVSPEAAFAALSQDDSVSNLASIVALVECDHLRMLLTGDALGTKITDAMEARGLIVDGQPFHVDILKMQHHGSDRNVTPEFFEKVTADHYVFSGDGSHGNPERATLQMLFDAYDGREIVLHFSHVIEDIDVEREKDAVRHNRPWSFAKDSLRTLLDAKAPKDGPVSISVPSDRTGIRIDLKDPVPV